MPFTGNIVYTVASGKVSGTQIDFPVLIHLRDALLRTTGNGGAVTSSSGFDIRPYSDSGLSAALSFELVAYDGGTGRVEIWVKVPSLTDGYVIYLAYGDSSITTDGSATGTWNTNFKVVTHHGAAGTIDITDSTANGFNGTNNGLTAIVAGQISGGSRSTGTQNGFISGSSTIVTGTALTFEGWFKTNGTGAGLFVKSNTSAYDWMVYAAASNYHIFLVTAGTGAVSVDTGIARSSTTWHYIVGVYNGSTLTAYVDGASVGSPAAATGNIQNGASSRVGWSDYLAGTTPIDGSYDETRVSDSARSAGWILTCYNNQSNPYSFFGLTPPAPCTGSSPNLSVPTWEDLQDCHDTVAVNGDTLTVAAGTYTVNEPILITKYVNIFMGGTVNLTDNTCPGVCDDTTLLSISESTAGSTFLKGPLHITQGTATHGSPAGVISLSRVSSGLPVLVKDIHMHHTLAGSSTFFEVTTNQGVIWACSITGIIALSGSCFNGAAFVRHKPSGLGMAGWETAATFGDDDADGKHALYIEGNTITDALEANDIDDDARTVLRWNTFSNAVIVMHGTDSGGQMGPRYFEAYYNRFDYDGHTYGAPCSGPINMNNFISSRGGTFLLHHNYIDDIPTKDELQLVDWKLRRSAGAYPCWDTVTIPGAGYPSPHQVGWGYITGATDPVGSGHAPLEPSPQDLEPVYIWANSGPGEYTTIPLGDFNPNECGGGAPTVTTYIQEGREFYTSSSAPSGKPGYAIYTCPHPLTGLAGSCDTNTLGVEGYPLSDEEPPPTLSGLILMGQELN